MWTEKEMESGIIQSSIGFKWLPKVLGTFSGVPMIRIAEFGARYRGFPIFGNYQLLGQLCLRVTGPGVSRFEAFLVSFTLPSSRDKDLSLGLARELPGGLFKVQYDKNRAGPQRKKKSSFPMKPPFPGELTKLVQGGRILKAKLGCACFFLSYVSWESLPVFMGFGVRA